MKEKGPMDTGKNFLKTVFASETQDYWLAALLAIGALYLYMSGIGAYALWDPWEPKYAQAMREMAQRGDYFTPYLDGKIRWAKPILFYWAMAVPTLVGGINEFTVRLPSVIAAVLGVLALFFFLKRLHNRRTAVMGACILGTLPQYVYLARQAMPDMLLTLFLLAAMGFFALARFGKEHKRGFFGLFYVSVALAFLTKGPVAGVIVLGALLLFFMVEVKPSRIFKDKNALSELKALAASYHLGMGVVIFICIALPWYALMFAKHGYIFIDTFFRGENIHRFVEPVRGHYGLATYYLRTFFHGMYPWSGFLPVGILFLFSQTRALDQSAQKRWYYLCWGISIFLTFTIAGTKQQHYILPLTPMVAILVALVWDQYFQKEAPFWIPAVFLLSIAFVLLPVRDFLLVGNKYIFDNFTNKRTIDSINVAIFLKWWFVAWASVMIAAFFWRRSRIIAVLAVLVAYVNGVYFSQHVMPRHEKTRTLKHYAVSYLAERATDAKLIFYGKPRASLNYYLGRDQYEYFSKHETGGLAAFVKNHKAPVYIIAEHKYKKRLMERLKKTTPFKWRIVSAEHPRYDLIAGLP